MVFIIIIEPHIYIANNRNLIKKFGYNSRNCGMIFVFSILNLFKVASFVFSCSVLVFYIEQLCEISHSQRQPQPLNSI